ncbi:MAG: hypothetical protein ACAI38_24825 [Myxococcota bacterium]
MRLATLAAIVIMYAARLAHACSCVPPRPAKVELERADAVFHGTVVSIEPVESAGAASTSPEGRLAVTFEVARVWKGDITKKLVVSSISPHVGMCEIDFAVGEEWVIYGTDKDGKLHTGLCTRSHRTDKKKPSADLKVLGAGKPPKVPAAP